MGSNDAGEMLEAAQAECVRLERALANMTAVAEGRRALGMMAVFLADSMPEPQIRAGRDDYLAKAWDDGWHEHYLEWERQRADPSHPITKTNPYQTGTRP